LPDVCACITSSEDVGLAMSIRDLVSLYEVRIDLIGHDWPRVVAGLPRPWIACNRAASQGGSCDCDEDVRIAELHRAVALGASIVDIEMTASGALPFISTVKDRVRVLVSHHDFERTEEEETLADLVRRQRNMGADICKVVTTARCTEDAVTMLRLTRRFRSVGIVAFAMGPLGTASRVLAPLAGAPFTYASLTHAHEAAPGQLTVVALKAMYDAMGVI